MYRIYIYTHLSHNLFGQIFSQNFKSSNLYPCHIDSRSNNFIYMNLCVAAIHQNSDIKMTHVAKELK